MKLMMMIILEPFKNIGGKDGKSSAIKSFTFLPISSHEVPFWSFGVERISNLIFGNLKHEKQD